MLTLNETIKTLEDLVAACEQQQAELTDLKIKNICKDEFIKAQRADIEARDEMISTLINACGGLLYDPELIERAKELLNKGGSNG